MSLTILRSANAAKKRESNSLPTSSTYEYEEFVPGGKLMLFSVLACTTLVVGQKILSSIHLA